MMTRQKSDNNWTFLTLKNQPFIFTDTQKNTENENSFDAFLAENFLQNFPSIKGPAANFWGILRPRAIAKIKFKMNIDKQQAAELRFNATPLWKTQRTHCSTLPIIRKACNLQKIANTHLQSHSITS